MSTQRTHVVSPEVASAASVHAAITLTTVPQTITTGITSPDVCRVLSITGNAAGIVGNVTVNVTDANGEVNADVIALNGVATVLGVVGSATLTSIELPARTHAGDTVSIGYGDVFGLPGHIADTTDVTQAERMATGATTYTSEAIGAVSETYSTVAAVIVAGDTMRWTYYDRGLDGQDIGTLRRMIAEPTTATYSDSLLSEYIGKYALTDSEGYEPDDTSWTPTYDLNRAASVIWYEKAMLYVGDYAFTADGSTFHREQAYQQAMKAASRFASMAAPSSLEVHVDHDYERDYQSTYWSDPTGTLHNYVVNGPQPGEDD
jgi:hypothetical protein